MLLPFGQRLGGGRATGNLSDKSSSAALKLITNMKKVINWNTMSRIGVRFGSAFRRRQERNQTSLIRPPSHTLARAAGAAAGRRLAAGSLGEVAEEFVGTGHRGHGNRHRAVAEEREERNGHQGEPHAFERQQEGFGNMAGNLVWT